MVKRVVSIAVFALFIIAADGFSDIIHVPGEQPTIQAGINASVNGDTVLVADGIYTGEGNRDLDFNGKAIILRSEMGPENCVIDCQGTSEDHHIGFHFHSLEDELSQIRGFKIQNGYGTSAGGIYCSAGSPTITECEITDCYSSLAGSAVFSESSDPIIEFNVIYGNQGTYGAIVCYNNTFPVIRGNIIRDNGGAGILVRDEIFPTILDNIIVDNDGAGIEGESVFGDIAGNVICRNMMGGISIDMPDGGTISNNLISGNSAPFGGGVYLRGICCMINFRNNTIIGNIATSDGGGLCIAGYSSPLAIENCIFWNNTGTEIFVDSSDPPVVSYSDIEGGYVGVGNIDADPLFIAGPDGCNYLSNIATGQSVDSPCVDAGNAVASTICYSVVDETVCMSDLTTRIDEVNDYETVDMGYHHGRGPLVPCPSTVSADYSCEPAFGILPFQTTMSVSLGNLNITDTRRIAGLIDVNLASGNGFSSWRSGWTNVAASDSYATSWIQDIPELGSVIGDNVFSLRAEDVTPVPYNQPPYPPAGDTDTTICTVTGVSP